MINPSNVAIAVQERLANHPTLSDVGAVYRNETINKNAGLTPWVCVYRAAVQLEPYTLGVGGRWKGAVQIDVCAQYSVPGNSEATEEGLDDLVQRILTAVFEDKQFGGVVASTIGVDIDYAYKRDENASKMDFQTALITLKFDMRTT